MRNTWTVVCHESDVARDGDYVVIPAGHLRDEPRSPDGSPASELAVTNTDGVVWAWDNRCSHRGSRVYTGPMQGNQPPRCPYHGRMAKPGTANPLPQCHIGPWIAEHSYECPGHSVDRNQAPGRPVAKV